MSLLNILRYPDHRLRTKARPVVDFGNIIENFANDLLETMYAAPGIGLAATQVDVHSRIVVVDTSENRDEPHILVNPSLELHGEVLKVEEGCLSLPGIYEPVSRSQRIVVQAQTPLGESFTFAAEGMLAVCIQHECDHLEGKLFVDYLSSLKRNRIRKKLNKQQTQSE